MIKNNGEIRVQITRTITKQNEIFLRDIAHRDRVPQSYILDTLIATLKEVEDEI